MKRAELVSTNLRRASWCEGTLKITFHHGGVYAYSGVPESIFDALVTAPSAGVFFAKNVRGVYPFVLVGNEAPGVTAVA